MDPETVDVRAARVMAALARARRRYRFGVDPHAFAIVFI
jgi:hypothetical protein